MGSLARHYADALIASLQKDLCVQLLSREKQLKICFEHQDWLSVMRDPFIAFEKKLAFLESFLELQEEKIHQALFIVAQANRLMLLPEIFDEIKQRIAECKTYRAVLYVQERLDSDLLQAFRSKIEERIGHKVEIEEQLWNQSAIKCRIDELFLEIAFSKEKLVCDLKRFISDSFVKGVQIES